MSAQAGELVVIRADEVYHMHHRIKPDVERLSRKVGVYMMGPAGQSPFHKVIVGTKIAYVDSKRFRICVLSS